MKQQKPLEIVVIGGKGGTGKTTITASLADIIPDKIVIDVDVDAANLYLLMRPENIRGTDFKGKSIAAVNRELCVSCNRCKELCRFHAIAVKDGYYQVDDLSCDGCGLCEIGCPVIAAASGAHLAIIVTEPTYSGISDLERVFALVNHFKINCGIVINRWDINPENTRKIEDFAQEKGVPVYARIPHSSCIIDAISQGKLPARACKVLARQVEQIYKYTITEKN
ncbi:MAG: hypothetical protein GTO45_28050 [Candidatus Aminicenantes bacterium]|nr:hypothetical protein [Candidatus Aminicenantes bacterium]NIM82653.1 hypothetical protein [Candidatus Aminicenantes bacterium]NIN22023.1 hypothetical protein [Candidatus Aminicenantes bacterium]NIN45783.1 hypothetical protein [Candidatus Aminicenantes bacterium]NIN88621.1 hypothetical protein [Candidatus Aminicenantes bacterium]